VSLYRMFDAAHPPTIAYPGCQAAAGYIGGNTPHVWTAEEWQRFDHLYQFAIWTGAGRTDGKADGIAAAAAMRKLGFRPFDTNRRHVWLDMEGQANAGYVNAFAAEVWAGGYQTGIYEDMAAVGGNPVKEGVWLADWNGQATIPPEANVVAHQYLGNVAWDGTQVDLSVVTAGMLAHGGQGPRR
jgi:hypothetical protein